MHLLINFLYFQKWQRFRCCERPQNCESSGLILRHFTKKAFNRNKDKDRWFKFKESRRPPINRFSACSSTTHIVSVITALFTCSVEDVSSRVREFVLIKGLVRVTKTVENGTPEPCVIRITILLKRLFYMILSLTTAFEIFAIAR